MKIWSNNFADGAAIPAANAFGKHNSTSHVELSDNRSPHIGIADVPAQTKSLVVICHDRDVPSSPEHVNQEGKTVPADLPRVDYYHWVQVDLPADITALDEGEFSSGVTARGKPGPRGPRGSRAGLNDYCQWFEGDADMAGEYFSYDGPCPPWNDSIIHHYHFTVYALDVSRLPLEGTFNGPLVLAAMNGHVLAKAAITGTYRINPDAK